VRRAEFFARSLSALAAASLLRPIPARAQSPQLRVLLGPGDAQPLPGGGFEFAGRQYRGTFARGSGGNLINTLPVEEYLYSVVPREMSPAWPSVALQVQAICSRTFVLRRVDPSRPYDVGASSLEQVYDGIGTESPAGRAAVDATAGQALLYGTSYANVVYSSCCGGHTESASDAWGGPPVPYMRGVACPYCTQSPMYRWSVDVALDVVAEALHGASAGLDPLESLSLGDRDASGRVRSFTLLFGDGSSSISGNDLRLALGAQLPSLLIFALTTDNGGTVRIDGGGDGHGVGLCQWGARGIALAGGSVAATLAFYFPGTKIAAWTSASPLPTTTNSRQV
jgi:stage II sporulation protein D